MAIITPTAEQVAFIDAVRTGENVTCLAAAGAGKTTSLVAASEVLPGRGIFTAFNKKIVADSKRKFDPSRVSAATLHSFAYRAMCTGPGRWRADRMNASTLYGTKLARAIGANDPHPVKNEYVNKMLSPGELASLAVVTVTRWCDSDEDEIQWWHVPARPGMDDRATRRGIAEAVLPLARRVWADLSKPDGTLRRTHSHYLKEWALSRPQLDVDYIMLDEAQDTNGVTLSVLRAQTDTQIIVVGDENQAIYTFRGSVDAMHEFGGTVCTLTQSFRFGPEVAEWANYALELNGSDLRVRGFDKITSHVGPVDLPDAILTRTNAAAVAQAMKFQAAGVPVALLGGGEDVARMAEAAAKLMRREWFSHPDLDAFDSWGAVQQYVQQDAGGADLKVFVKLVDDYGTDAIIAAMRNLASPSVAQITLSTAHKCKGAEWGSVQVGPDFSEPKRDEDGNYQIGREAMMLNYVTLTRPKTALDTGSLSWLPRVLAEVRGDRAGLLGGEGIVRQVETEAIVLAPEPEPEPVAEELVKCNADRLDGRFAYQNHTWHCDRTAGHLSRGEQHQQDRFPGYPWTNPGDKIAVSA